MLVEKVLEPLPIVAWNKGLKTGSTPAQTLAQQNRAPESRNTTGLTPIQKGHVMSESTRQAMSKGAKSRVAKNPDHYRNHLANIAKKRTKFYCGKTYREWAEHFGVTSVTIHNYMKQYGNLDRLKEKA